MDPEDPVALAAYDRACARRGMVSEPRAHPVGHILFERLVVLLCADYRMTVTREWMGGDLGAREARCRRAAGRLVRGETTFDVEARAVTMQNILDRGGGLPSAQTWPRLRGMRGLGSTRDLGGILE